MSFSSINIQGNIISSDVLQKIRQDDMRFQKAADFGLDRNTTVRDEIGIAWASVQAHWKAFKLRKDRLKEGDSGTSETRQGWMIPFLRELGYDLDIAKAEIINEKSYAISHRASNRDGFPVHIAGVGQSLDKRTEGGIRLSPHALVQEYLNNSEHLYAITTNGSFLRLLRDATRLARLSYLEFDLERMMEEELYAEFAVLFRVLHATRMPASLDTGSDSYIEFYHQEALASGTRIRERLSKAVEKSIKLLGNGLLKQHANKELQAAAEAGELNPDEYYLHLLRTVYRILFLMVIEERNLIFPAKRDKEADEKRDIYYKFYSLQRLTKLAENKVYVDPRKTDLWRSMMTTFLLFENGFYGKKLGIQPLGSGLFSSSAIGDFVNQQMDNQTLLSVLSCLVMFENENKQWTRVNYADLDVEEFGSVYEGLLEYDPLITMVNDQAHFGFVEGTGRSSSGSHYTPEELVKPLIKHSLDYVIEDKIKEAIKPGADRIAKMKAQCEALLTIKVCDVACGSGHILLSAARRIGMELAILRESMTSLAQVEQPSPTFLRQAIRDVIGHCIYGVDKNPLAVELCKVAFWLEAHNPGEPLNFLDHHIKCGDAIVGLAHADELNKGIASEAFKTLPGDDKEVAAAFRKQNEAELKNKGQLGAFEMESVDLDLKNIQKLFADFDQLPENTLVEITAKEKAYKKLRSNGQMNRIKELADLQIAQFFIPKTIANQDRLTTHSQYFTYLTQGGQILDRGLSMAKAYEGRYFHWFLEFPEVFQNARNEPGRSGGFDCILGNPPFLGGQKLSGSFGDNFLECIKYQFAPIGAVDLVTYFFRRIFTIIKQRGFQSLISTNTIAQGRSREDGLEEIVLKGGTINHAVKSMKWPGIAAVEVALVTITKQRWKGKSILAGKEVKTITSYLDDNETLGSPFQLKANEGKSYQGSIVLGKGFVLVSNEAEALIAKDVKNKDIIFPYLNGDDLNNSPDQNSSRWVINFFDWTEEKAKQYPDCYQIVEQLVKPDRQRWAIDKNGNEIIGEHALRKPLPEKWWIYGEKRPALYNAISSLELVLVVARISKTVAFELLKKRKVFADALVVFPLNRYSQLAIMQSTIHNNWAWMYCTTMKADLNYTPGQTFDTFSFPKNLSPQLETIGETYHKHRKQIMLGMQLGLTKTYNLFHSNGITAQSINEKDKQVIGLRKHLSKTEDTIPFDEAIQGILKLRELHIQMDEAVLDAYGWSFGNAQEPAQSQAINLRHDFYEVDYLPENDRVRFTIHPDARKEVLKRLLELNHKVYEEEIKQGLHKIADVEKFYEQKGEAIPEQVRLLMGSKGKEKKPSTKKKQVDGGLFGEGE